MQGAEEYDRLFFESFPSPERHIDRLYVMALLSGLAPARPSIARILEIGCSTALNLIPQAELYRESHFTGIDLSAFQIEKGREAIQTLGLTNITLKAQDVRNFAGEASGFDYIICHGLYSWVTADIRTLLLQKIADLLAPQGVAYLSFNTLLAWNRRTPVRTIVLQHDAVNQPMRQRIARARHLLTSLRELVSEFPGDSGESFLTEIHRTLAESDAILAHEYLNHSLKTFTVSAIEQDARKYGLSYIGDARQRRNAERYLLQLDSGALKQRLEQASRAEREDMFDVIEGKSFRAALFVKADTTGTVRWPVESLKGLMVASPLVPVDIGHVDAAATFMMGNGAAVEIQDTAIASMLQRLHGVWPRPLPLAEFPAIGGSAVPGGLLERLVWNQMIELSHTDYSCCSVAKEFPCISAYARYQARQGGIVPTLRHEQCEVNAFERLLLTWLDGAHGRDQLIDRMLQAVESGVLRVLTESNSTIDRAFIGEQIDATLVELAERGMFCA